MTEELVSIVPIGLLVFAAVYVAVFRNATVGLRWAAWIGWCVSLALVGGLICVAVQMLLLRVFGWDDGWLGDARPALVVLIYGLLMVPVLRSVRRRLDGRSSAKAR